MTTPPPQITPDSKSVENSRSAIRDDARRTLHSDSMGERLNLKSLDTPQIPAAISERISQQHEARKSQKAHSPSNSLRSASTEEISEMSDEELFEALKSENSYVRIDVITEFANRVNEQELPLTTQIIRAISDQLIIDKDPFVKAVAATMLGQIGSEFVQLTNTKQEVSKSLVNALTATGPDSQFVRLCAVQALDSFRYPETVPDLAKALGVDPDLNVRVAVAQSLGSMGAAYNLNATWTSHIEYRKIRELSVPALIESLAKDPVDEVKKAAANALGYIADERSVEPLTQALVRYRANPEVGQEVAFALLFMTFTNRPAVFDSRVPQKMLEIAGSSDNANLRTPAIDLLNAVGNQDAVPTLIRSLTDDNYKVRNSAAVALGSLGDIQAIPALKSAYDVASDKPLKLEIAQSLSRLGDDYGFTTLVESLKDKKIDLYLRSFTAAELGKMGNPAAIQPLFDLYTEMKDSYVDTRSAVLSAIVDSARNDLSAKALVAQKLGLDGPKLEFWNRFGIVVQEGREKYTPDMYKRMLATFDSETRKETGVTNIVTSEVAENGIPNFSATANFQTKTISTYLPYMRDPNWFSEAMFHEHGHLKYGSLKVEDQVKYDRLYWKACNSMFKDGSSSDNFPSNFVSGYSLTNSREFQAEVESQYRLNTFAMVLRAKGENSKNLKEQVATVASLMAEKGEDGQMYTYAFRLNSDGSIWKAAVRMDSEGLPTETLVDPTLTSRVRRR